MINVDGSLVKLPDRKISLRPDFVALRRDEFANNSKKLEEVQIVFDAKYKYLPKSFKLPYSDQKQS